MIEIYADGADVESIIELNKEDKIKGFTTNPTLMKKAGVTNYLSFAKEVLSHVTEKPISFEVFAVDCNGITEQAKLISSWGKNVYVKIPVMNPDASTNYALMNALSLLDIKINATAVMTMEQIKQVVASLDTRTPSIISIFAGRIADTGMNPYKPISYGKLIKKKNQKILWASTREVYNIREAEQAGADIITVTPELLKKVRATWGKDLYDVSLETCKMFYHDALQSGFKL